MFKRALKQNGSSRSISDPYRIFITCLHSFGNVWLGWKKDDPNLKRKEVN
jgi:hypothetical protein